MVLSIKKSEGIMITLLSIDTVKEQIMTNSKTITMQFHPRAFAAFGADLVTNDVVAVTELVKNCYDAFAYNVIVEFGTDSKGEFIKISDDGLGMTSEIIETSWAVIATPYKQKNPTVKRGGEVRRVSGNKGLGRFSAARLGSKMAMRTQSESGSCLQVIIDWNSFLNSSNISDCKVTITQQPDYDCFNTTGTIIKIRQLSSSWNEEMIYELKDNLSRLITPFKKVDSFSIKLISPFEEEPIEIKPTKLIENPLYSIEGDVNHEGVITWKYIYAPKNKKHKPRTKQGSIDWEEARQGFNTNIIPNGSDEDDNIYSAGQFSFEIRVWDLDKDRVADLKNTFNLKQNEIRRIIGQYKGLSVYRDNILVLPKSVASKDWLGIDLRRISRIGKRISTSQIIGIIYISSEKNPEIRDTTDREKLVDTIEYGQFARAIETVIMHLENLRHDDKEKDEEQEKQGLNNLIAPLSAQTLVSKIEAAVDSGEKPENILGYVQDYYYENEKGLVALQNRLTYYAQTASLGSIAIVILHEMLTGLTVLKRFLRRAIKKFSPFDEKTQEDYDDAERSHSRIMEVTQSFAPLYRKDLRKTVNSCDLHEAMERSIRLVRGQKYAKDVLFINNLSNGITAKMFDGELQTIFVNILDNACYWLQKTEGNRKIFISDEQHESKGRCKVIISDTGPGVYIEDAQSIFEPGITNKPHGIGMGLVIVTEILSYYEGKIATVIPGLHEGATFVFDIPIS